MSEHFRPSWGKLFHEQTVHHPLDLRVTKLKVGGFRVDMMGGGFLATDAFNLLDRLLDKKHLGLEGLYAVFSGVRGEKEEEEIDLEFISWWQSRLQNDGLVWQKTLVQDQAEVG